MYIKNYTSSKLIDQETKLKSCLSILFLFALCMSCNSSEEKKTTLEVKKENLETLVIDHTLKINFLKEILKDKNNKILYAYNYTNPYIKYKSNKYVRNKDVRYQGRMGKPSTFPEYINSFFNSKDTTYIINQIASNNTLSIGELSNYGYNILDWKTIHNDSLKTNDGFLISKDSLERLSEHRSQKREFTIYGLIFNKSLNLAYISVDYFMSHGTEMLYKKVNNKWVFHKIIGGYQY
ncbi:hypothetical protein [Psychroserpens sp.]|uniref:hypothetical protein n=1 Tax=Psychroserpens sp. TaxID=2020870 RepID=UPI00385CE4AD